MVFFMLDRLNPSFPSKKFAPLILFLMIFMTQETTGQIIIRNPNKPKSKHAGRTVLLEEVMRIRDDGEQSVFNIPRNFIQSKDGSLFFTDYVSEPCLYKYSKDGRFLFNALKKGEGPQETNMSVIYFLMGNRIRAQSWQPPKIMDYDLSGRFIREISTDIPRPFWLIWYAEGKTYGIRDEIPFSNSIKENGFIETPFRLYEISEDFQKLKTLYDFPVRHYIKHRRWWRIDMVEAASHLHFLFMVHTAEYNIVKFDLHKTKIERIFSRRYKRQKIHDKDIEQLKPGSPAPPRAEFYFDISKLLIFRNNLWVITSTSKSNGSLKLVDVFDTEGHYIDSFYLKFPANDTSPVIGFSLLTDEGYLFVPEQDSEGFASIAKYAIKDVFFLTLAKPIVINNIVYHCLRIPYLYFCRLP